jgi:hypothetical protein
MKIKMPSGVILECDNDDINESRLLAGGVEVIEKPAKENATKKKSAKSDEEE